MKIPTNKIQIGGFGLLLLIGSVSLQATDPPVIVIDPGHGGNKTAGALAERSNSSPNNATSPGGIREKDLTLEFSNILKEEILAAAKAAGPTVGVILTRVEDVNIDFVARAAAANHQDTACVVSIHFNAGGGKQARGSLSLISSEERNPNFEIDRKFGEGLAAACAEGVGKVMPGAQDRGIMTDGHLHGGLGSNFFFQMALYQSLRSVPKVFLEIEFIDNTDVEKELLKGNREEKFRVIARSVAIFLVEYVTKD